MKIRSSMKALSLAVIGLAGLGFGANAFAVCPTGIAVSDSPAGAWSSKAVTSGALAIVNGGNNGTACRVASSLNQNASIIAKAQFRDDTPANETSYRFRVYFDTTELGTNISSLRSAQLLVVNGGTAPAGANQYLIKGSLIKISGVSTLRLLVSDTSQPGNTRNVDVPLTVEAGVNRFEGFLTVGASSTLKYWMTNEAAVSADATPTGTVSGINNAGWTGVDSIVLGLASASNGYRSFFPSTTHVYFDEFDSRRTSFIGK